MYVQSEEMFTSYYSTNAVTSIEGNFNKTIQPEATMSASAVGHYKISFQSLAKCIPWWHSFSLLNDRLSTEKRLLRSNNSVSLYCQISVLC